MSPVQPFTVCRKELALPAKRDPLSNALGWSLQQLATHTYSHSHTLIQTHAHTCTVTRTCLDLDVSLLAGAAAKAAFLWRSRRSLPVSFPIVVFFFPLRLTVPPPFHP